MRCLVSGLGSVGFKYDLNLRNKIQTHSKSIFLNKNFTLVGGVDPDIKTGKVFHRIYKAPFFDNLQNGIKKTKPELVVVSSPTDTHLNSIKKIVLNKSVKIIICEKPLGSNLSQSKKIVQLCKRNHIKLFVNYMRISEPSSHSIKKYLNKSNEKVTCDIFYSKGFYHTGSHFFNLAEMWFGKYVGLIKLIKKNKINNNDYNLDAILDFKNSEVRFNSRKILISKNYIIINFKNKKIKYLLGGKKIIIEKNNKKKIKKKIILKNYIKIYQKNFYTQLFNFLKKKNNYICTGQQALNTLININRILTNKK